MAKVKVTINGVTFEMDAKGVPAFLASIGQNKAVPAAASKTYIGEKELNDIAKKASDAEDFVLSALSKQDGIHTVYSGLNKIIRNTFNTDPRTVTDKMASDGLIVINPTKGGVRISLKK